MAYPQQTNTKYETTTTTATISIAVKNKQKTKEITHPPNQTKPKQNNTPPSKSPLTPEKKQAYLFILELKTGIDIELHAHNKQINE